MSDAQGGAARALSDEVPIGQGVGSGPVTVMGLGWNMGHGEKDIRASMSPPALPVVISGGTPPPARGASFSRHPEHQPIIATTAKCQAEIQSSKVLRNGCILGE